MLNILFLAICAGVSLYLSTFLGEFYSPLLMTGIRGLVSGITILIIQYRANPDFTFDLIKYKHRYITALGFGFLVPLIIQSFIMTKLAPVEMAIISSTEPMLTYTLAYIFFSEKLHPRQVYLLFFGSLLAFSAIVLEAGFDRISLISWHEPLLVFVISLTGFGWLTISRLISDYQQSEDIVAAMGFLSTGVLAIILALHFEKIQFSAEVLPISSFLILILFGDLIATRMRIRLSKFYTQTMLALMNIFSPFTIALNEIIFHHRHYSSKFFLLIIPSIICFITFYLVEKTHKPLGTK